MAKPKEKEPVDIVHQNAIHVETIKKELRHQKLYTEFNINPFKKMHILTDKPMSNISNRKEQEDPGFLKAIHGARLEPTKKYSHPQTEAQEIGWISSPLDSFMNSKRFHGFHNNVKKKNCEGFCDTENWSDGAENSALNHTRLRSQRQKIKLSTTEL